MNKKVEDIIKQENEATLNHFTLSDIDKLNDCIRDVAKENYDNVVVEMFKNDRLVFFHAGKNTTSENNLWARKKYNVVKQYDHSSLFEKYNYNQDNDIYYKESGFSPKNYAIVGGGFPINVKSVGTCGILVISGLTDEEDHEVCFNALKSLKELQ